MTGTQQKLRSVSSECRCFVRSVKSWIQAFVLWMPLSFKHHTLTVFSFVSVHRGWWNAVIWDVWICSKTPRRLLGCVWLRKSKVKSQHCSDSIKPSFSWPMGSTSAYAGWLEPRRNFIAGHRLGRLCKCMNLIMMQFFFPHIFFKYALPINVNTYIFYRYIDR